METYRFPFFCPVRSQFQFQSQLSHRLHQLAHVVACYGYRGRVLLQGGVQCGIVLHGGMFTFPPSQCLL